MDIGILAVRFQEVISQLPPETVKLIGDGKKVPAATVIVQDALSTYLLLNGSERGRELAFTAMQSVIGGTHR